MWGVGTAGGHGGFNEPGCEPLSGDKIVPLTFLTKVQKMKYPSDGFIRADERKVSPIIQQFAGEMQIYEEDGLKAALQKAVENWQERREIPHCLTGIENIETDWPVFCQNFGEEWRYLVSLTERIPAKAVTQGTGSAMNRAYFNLVVADGSYKRTSVHNVLENPVNSEGTLSVLQLAPNSCFVIEETAAEYLHNRDEYFLYKPEDDEWKAFEDAKIEDNFIRYGQRMEWSRIWQHRKEKGKSQFLEGLFKSGVISGGEKVLSLGCGDGVDEIFMAEKGCVVTATDFVKECVNLTAKRAVEHNVKDRVITREQNLLEPLSFSDNEFDIIYANGSLHYFNDRQMRNIIGEAWRVLRQGGKFCIKVRSTDDFRYEKAKLDGLLIDKDTYLMPDGVICRFFSQVTIKEFLVPFIDVEVNPVEKATPDGTVSHMLEITTRKPANIINERIKLAHSKMTVEGVIYTANSYKDEFGVSLVVAQNELESLASLDHEERADDAGRIVDPLSGIEKTYPGKADAPYIPDYEKGPIYRKMVINPDIFRAFDIRDITDINLSDKTAFYVGLGFAQLLPSFLNKHENLWIAIGQDVREGGNRLRKSVIRGLVAGGVNVYDMVDDGNDMFLSTPEIYFSTTLLEADGGLNITASHRDGWSNGIKQCIRTEDGYVTNLGREHMEKIKRIVIEKEKLRLSNKRGTRIEVPSRTISEYHKKLVENDIFLGPEAASDYLKTWRNTPPDKRAPLRKIIDEINGRHVGEKPLDGIVAVIDLNNGAGQRGPDIYRELGAECVTINKEPNGRYPQHDPDPAITKNLDQLMTRMSWCAIREELRLAQNSSYNKKEVVGLSYDSDADRLGIVRMDAISFNGKEIEKSTDLYKYINYEEPPDSIKLEFKMDDLYGETIIYFNNSVLAKIKTKVILADRLTLMLGKPLLETVFGKSGIIINDVKASSKECNEYVSLLGGRYLEERTGFFNIKDRIRKEESKGNRVIVGGELSCHLYVSEWRNWRSDNALFMGANVLSMVAQARSGKNIGVSQNAGKKMTTLKDLDEDIPNYPSTSEIRIPLSTEYTIDQRERLLVQPVVERLKSQGVDVSTTDGGKFVFYDKNGAWEGTVLLRKSNTENSLSVRAWGRTEEVRDILCNRVIVLIPERNFVVIPSVDFGATNLRIAFIARDCKDHEIFGEPRLLWVSYVDTPWQIVNDKKKMDIDEVMRLIVSKIKEGINDLKSCGISSHIITELGFSCIGAWKDDGFAYPGSLPPAPHLEKINIARGLVSDLGNEWDVHINNDGVANVLLAVHYLLDSIEKGKFGEAREALKISPKIIGFFPGTGFGAGGFFLEENRLVPMPGPQQFFDIAVQPGKGEFSNQYMVCEDFLSGHSLADSGKKSVAIVRAYPNKEINGELMAKALSNPDEDVKKEAIRIFRQAGKALGEAIISLHNGTGKKVVLSEKSIEKQFWEEVKGCRIFIFGGWLVKDARDILFPTVREYLAQKGYGDINIIAADQIPGLEKNVKNAGILGASLLVPADVMKYEKDVGKQINKPTIDIRGGYIDQFKTLKSALLKNDKILLAEECKRIYQAMSNRTLPRLALYQFLLSLEKESRSKSAELVKSTLTVIDKEKTPLVPINYRGRDMLFSRITGFIYYKNTIRIPSGVRTLADIWDHIPATMKKIVSNRNINPNNVELYFTNENIDGINLTILADPAELNLPFWNRNAGHTNGSYLEAYEVVAVTEGAEVALLSVKNRQAKYVMGKQGDIIIDNPLTYTEILTRGGWVFLADTMRHTKELQVPSTISEPINSDYSERGITLPIEKSFEGIENIIESEWQDICFAGEKMWDSAASANPLHIDNPLYAIVSKILSCLEQNKSSVIDKNDIRDVIVPYFFIQYFLNTDKIAPVELNKLYSLCRDAYDLESNLVLTLDLLHEALMSNRNYEIKYDASRLSPSQIDMIETYIGLLQKRASNSNSIKAKPFSSIKGSKESLIAVYCTGDNFKGEGHVDIEIPEGKMQDYLLRIAGMLNIALAASNIPNNATEEEVKTTYGPIIGFIKNQYKKILGSELVIPDGLEDMLKTIRYIVLTLPKAYRMPLEKIEEYNRLAKQALIAA